MSTDDMPKTNVKILGSILERNLELITSEGKAAKSFRVCSEIGEQIVKFDNGLYIIGNNQRG